MQVVRQRRPLPAPRQHLLLDGKRRIEQRTLVEMTLLGNLHLHDEPGPGAVRAFHVEVRVVTVTEGAVLPHRLATVLDADDAALRQQLTQDAGEGLPVALCAENLLEPLVHKDVDVARYCPAAVAELRLTQIMLALIVRESNVIAVHQPAGSFVVVIV